LSIFFPATGFSFTYFIQLKPSQLRKLGKLWFLMMKGLSKEGNLLE